MKRILILLMAFTALHAGAQNNSTISETINAKKVLTVHGRSINGITNDVSMPNDTAKVPTAAAVHAYVLAHAGGGTPSLISTQIPWGGLSNEFQSTAAITFDGSLLSVSGRGLFTTDEGPNHVLTVFDSETNADIFNVNPADKIIVLGHHDDEEHSSFKIGINKETPEVELDVVGDAVINNNTNTAKVGINNPSPSAALDMIGELIVTRSAEEDRVARFLNTTDGGVGGFDIKDRFGETSLIGNDITGEERLRLSTDGNYIFGSASGMNVYFTDGSIVFDNTAHNQQISINGGSGSSAALNVGGSGSVSGTLRTGVPTGGTGNAEFKIGNIIGSDPYDDANLEIEANSSLRYIRLSNTPENAGIFSNPVLANNWISVATFTAPTEALDVNGNAKVSGDGYFGGNVGIGTTTPGYKLEVSGNTKVSGTISNNNGIIQPYKVYTARIFQSGTSAPTVTVYQNTIGAIVWTRTSTGLYSGTLAGAFNTSKTWLGHPNFYVRNEGNETYASLQQDNSNVVQLAVLDSSLATTDTFDYMDIEIRVYN